MGLPIRLLRRGCESERGVTCWNAAFWRGMMPTISLTSFLKILTKGTPQKVQEYSKYLTPGGYDFYWQLKEAAVALTIGGASLADCAKPIEKIKRDVEKKHNLAGLKSLSKWKDKQKV